MTTKPPTMRTIETSQTRRGMRELRRFGVRGTEVDATSRGRPHAARQRGRVGDAA
ncbi:hypothetical protein GCM10010968_14190 [Agrococcus terreus]|uniref:Uncharacterized protein n=1 Tax=Agrococcus terreus TaxID=574649 RepID=A0ABQ2KJY9_9MICO|nr:hypothetical protein GCM10010968_14190 [Agrococcus terreus]